MTESSHSAFAPLVTALRDRAMAGCPVTFWLRDDDAVEPCDSLNRLLALTEQFSVPLTLAVIPAYTGEALARRLHACEHVSVAVHGWSHTNYAGADEKKQELGNHRPQSDVLTELQRGFTRLAELHPSQFVPLLVPPWNRISAVIVDHLGELGFTGLSTFGEEKPTAVMSINTQVDIIDWKGTRGGRSLAALISEITACVQTGRSTIGILTHQLVHDEPAWYFLEKLFDVIAEHSDARWLSVSELLEC
ncbi:MAG: polysaccharide deacetylase family protein [Granulosicoccus sp.]